jgi:hypothetical protein
MTTLAEHAQRILKENKSADHVKIHMEGEAWRPTPLPKSKGKVKEYKPKPMPVYITDKPKGK